MIERESTGDGWQVRIVLTQGQRLLRLIPAAFLCVWLCGWAMGEYFAGGALVRILAGRYAPGMDLAWLPRFTVPAGDAALAVAAFLGVWLTVWTVGGCFAIGAAASLLFGVPVLRWSGSGVEMALQTGPFAIRRKLTWEQAEAQVNGIAAPQSVAGGKLLSLLGPLCDPADRDTLLGWLREGRERAGTTGNPEDVRAIG